MFKPCGIDFGTSNSAIAIGGNRVELVAVEDAHTTIPSALFFQSTGQRVFFGRAAQKAYLQREDGRFMRSLKRVLGTSLIDQSTVVNGKAESFKDIIATFIKNLKQKSEIAGHEVESVVMGRPVHFVDDDSRADLRAQGELEKIARQVGFRNVEFQYEPIAAAFAHEQGLSQEKLSLVVDIGGGTSDFTVIRLSPERKLSSERKSDILANTGVRVGGNDFDKELSVRYIMPHLGYDTTYGDKNLTVPKSSFHDLSEWSKVNFVYEPKTLRMFRNMLRSSHAKDKLCRFVDVLEHQQGHHLLDSVENAKIGLASGGEYTVSLDYIENGFSINLSVANLNKAILEEVKRIRKSIKDCLVQSGIRAEDIELIVLTGGSTEIPYIQKVLSEMFPAAELSQENKLASVVVGLAYDAKRKFL